MDQKLPIVAKKFWKIVCVVYFMLRKGLSPKRKLMFNLKLLMKRGKIAGEAIFQNLMFHDHNINHSHQSSSKEYYEFGCGNNPTFHLPFHIKFHINKRINKHSQLKHASEHEDVLMMNTVVLKALEMLQSETESPVLPGFGRSPTVRQLRITDSPFLLRSDIDNGEMINYVNQKADEFISRFYKELRREASDFA